MRMSRLVTITFILMLALFPAAVYAVTDHNHGAGSAGTTQKQDIGHSGGHNGHGTSGPAGGQGAAGGHGGHGGKPGKNVLEPFKNQIVAGFIALNLLVIIGAVVMKKKTGQEV